MIVLGLDTSTATLSLAVVHLPSRRVLAERTSPPGVNHAPLLPQLVDDALREAGLSLRELQGVAVGLGPGAFTGLRVAISTAKGLAYGAKLPLAGVSSLQAMAAAAVAQGVERPVPLLDARKGEVYAGFFRGVDPIEPEVALAPSSAAARLASMPGAIAFGDGCEAFSSVLGRSPAGLPLTPPASQLALLAAPRLRDFDKAAIADLEPTYLRSSDRDLSLGPPKPV